MYRSTQVSLLDYVSHDSSHVRVIPNEDWLVGKSHAKSLAALIPRSLKLRFSGIDSTRLQIIYRGDIILGEIAMTADSIWRIYLLRMLIDIAKHPEKYFKD